MAGGKETPRQKMIGMMYLVLTALLALNVSNAVLEKFAILDSTLSELRVEENVTNEKTLNAILGATSNAERVVDAKKRAQEVRDLTAKLLADLDGFKDVLKKDHKGVLMPTEEMILNTNIAEEKMLDARKPKLGKDFEKTLVDFTANLSALSGVKFKTLARTAADYEEFKNNTHHKDKDFLHFTFEGTPTMASITVITQMQTEALELEAQALDSLNEIAEGAIIKFDKVVPMVIGPSILAAGSKYEGRLFMAGAASGANPEMFRNGSPLTVSEDPETGIKMAKVEFTAAAGNYDANGLAKSFFDTEIRVTGKDPMKRRIDYMVARPVIRVTTGNAPTLYLNCGNVVNIDVPALGSSYQPSFTAKGAKIVPGEKPSRPTIIPTERKVAITVINGGAVLGTENFDVKNIPRPHVTKKDQTGKEVDPKNGAKISALQQLRVSVDPDDNFKNEVPKDAIYRIRSMEVLLRRGTAFVATKNVSSELIDVADWKGQMRPGDVIVCNIKAVIRKTFTGEDEKVEFTSYEYIPLQ